VELEHSYNVSSATPYTFALIIDATHFTAIRVNSGDLEYMQDGLNVTAWCTLKATVSNSFTSKRESTETHRVYLKRRRDTGLLTLTPRAEATALPNSKTKEPPPIVHGGAC
jgi:hypothetical protein